MCFVFTQLEFGGPLSHGTFGRQSQVKPHLSRKVSQPGKFMGEGWV